MEYMAFLGDRDSLAVNLTGGGTLLVFVTSGRTAGEGVFLALDFGAFFPILVGKPTWALPAFFVDLDSGCAAPPGGGATACITVDGAALTVGFN